MHGRNVTNETIILYLAVEILNTLPLLDWMFHTAPLKLPSIKNG